MTTPPPRHEPRQTSLDSEERALSEALKRVPASDPGAALDARVLAMARDALQPRTGNQARRNRMHRLSWLGSAAGAVLAVGIGWQLSQTEPGRDERTLRSVPAATPQMHESSAAPSLDVEVIRRPAPPASPMPQDAQLPAAAKPVAEPARAGAARSAKAEDAAAYPFAAQRRQRVARVDAEAEPPIPAQAPPPAAAPESAAAPAAGPTEESRAMENSDATTLERVEVSGSRIRRGDEVDADGFPPIARDARLQPREWIERIRARRAAGQEGNARKSLEDFARSYPYLVVPEDLRPLLGAAQ